MALTQVTVRTVEKDTTSYGGTEYKFYRTYEVPGIGTIMQWGSMKSGKSGGQFKHDASTYTATSKISDKMAEGYGNRVQEFIQVDASRLTGRPAKTMGEILDNIHSAGPSPSQPAPTFANPQPPKPEPKKPATVPPNPSAPLPDRITTLNARALEAITLAATEPMKALVELSKITDEVEAIETDLRKVRSYVSTLEVLTEEAMV